MLLIFHRVSVPFETIPCKMSPLGSLPPSRGVLGDSRRFSFVNNHRVLRARFHPLAPENFTPPVFLWRHKGIRSEIISLYVRHFPRKLLPLTYKFPSAEHLRTVPQFLCAGELCIFDLSSLEQPTPAMLHSPRNGKVIEMLCAVRKAKYLVEGGSRVCRMYRLRSSPIAIALFLLLTEGVDIDDETRNFPLVLFQRPTLQNWRTLSRGSVFARRPRPCLRVRSDVLTARRVVTRIYW